MEHTDYFSFFGLKPSLVLDEKELRALYMHNVKAFHPDFYIADPQLYSANLKKSSFNNDAYKVLSNLMSRTAYFLEIKGLYNPEQQTQLPPDFLMEVMELNEQLDEIMSSQNAQERSQFMSGIQQSIQEIQQELIHIGTQINENESPELLNEALTLFQKLKYFQNLLLRSQ